MKIKNLNEKLNILLKEEVIQPTITLIAKHCIDSDGYLKNINYEITLTPYDINGIILGLEQYPDTDDLIQKFEELLNIFNEEG